MKNEATEIINNARAAYKNGEITADELNDITIIPLKDYYLQRASETITADNVIHRMIINCGADDVIYLDVAK